MNREIHVRICESVRVRFPCATRLSAAGDWLLAHRAARLENELHDAAMRRAGHLENCEGVSVTRRWLRS